MDGIVYILVKHQCPLSRDIDGVKRSKGMRWICFCLMLISVLGCKKNIYRFCAVETKGLNNEEYKEVMIGYFDCLVNERIKQKSKKKLIKDIDQSTIEGAFLGFTGEMSDQYLSAMALNQILSKKEISGLYDSKSPALRYYGFRFLSERDSIDVFSLLQGKLHDTTRIDRFDGCIISFPTIADMCIKYVYPDNYSNIKNENSFQLSKSELNTIDSLVIAEDIKLDYVKEIQFKNRDSKVMYYQPDYNSDSNHIILSSGNDLNQLNEYWKLDEKDFKPPTIYPDVINWAALILNAKTHIQERFDLESIKLISIEIDKEFKDNPIKYAVISFEKDSSGFIEKLPMLLDGRIVLSNKEVD